MNKLDYPKFAGIYDHASGLVDPNNHTRNRKFALVTDYFNIYSVTDTTEVGGGEIAAPAIDVGSDKTISALPTNFNRFLYSAPGLCLHETKLSK